MKIKNKLKLLICLTLLSFVYTKGQVTIGNDESTAQGALLQLKDQTGITNGDANANKGLGLPRVKLLSTTIDTGDNLATTIDGVSSTDTWDKDEHTGLLVYHVSGIANPICADIIDGLYVWDGEEWMQLTNKDLNDGAPVTITLTDGTVELTDGVIIDIPSGNDKRTLGNLTLNVAWVGETLSLTPTENTEWGYSSAAGMFTTPAWTSGSEIAETDKPKVYNLQANDMSSVITATSPWKSREWELKFKAVNICGIEEIKTVTLNQTNFAMKVNESFEDSNLAAMKSVDLINVAVQANTTWKATVTQGANLLTVTANTDTGGSVLKNGRSGVNNFNFTPQIVPNAKYQKATIKFEDTSQFTAVKDITVTVQTCLDLEDLSGLTTATPAQTSGANIWGAAVVHHQAKAGVYEDFTSAHFGSAGRWMTTNLSAWAYDTRTPGTSWVGAAPTLGAKTYINHNTEARWAYPNIRDATDANDATIWNANKHLGMLYNWNAATGKQNTVTTDQSGLAHTRIQGICPTGWHLPSDREWTDLENYMKNNTTAHSSEPNNLGTTANDTPYGSDTPSNIPTSRAMREICQVGINTSNIIKEQGFGVMLAGMAGGGKAQAYGADAYLWTSSSYHELNTWFRIVTSSPIPVQRQRNGKVGMYSIRCKKD